MEEMEWKEKIIEKKDKITSKEVDLDAKLNQIEQVLIKEMESRKKKKREVEKKL